jgi:hypothetical protein
MQRPTPTLDAGARRREARPEGAVATPTNHDIAEAWGTANQARDEAGMRRLAHPDYVCDWPQTGERIHGIDAFIEIDRRYPGGLPDTGIKRLSGSEDRFVLDNLMVPRRITGSGDLWVAEVDVRYQDGSRWMLVSITELVDGLVRHETQYFAPEEEAPAWRADLTERIARPNA